MKKIKHKSVNKLKKECWDLFSKWVRSSVADYMGYSQCVTCGVRMPWKQLHAGHFIPGRHNSILFDKRGCHPQCYRCNVALKGNPRAYDAFMRLNYGEKVIRELEELDRQKHPFTVGELEELKTILQVRLKELLKTV